MENLDAFGPTDGGLLPPRSPSTGETHNDITVRAQGPVTEPLEAVSRGPQRDEHATRPPDPDRTVPQPVVSTRAKRSQPEAPAPPPADPLLGACLDQRYTIIEVIGRGGTGVVYRAKQLNLEREVAVKVLREGLEPGLAGPQRFRNEVRIISELRHPNTLRPIDFGTTPDGRPYFVTELLAGRSLRQIVRQGPLEPLQVVGFLRQICQSLAEAHARGIVHRDLKPENLFVEEVGDDEVVKVLDFGTAKVADQPKLSIAGVVLGTPGYVSPEQIQCRPADARTDLYSLGIIAYECLTGARPFTGSTDQEVLTHHVRTPAEPPSRARPGLPASLDALVTRMLAKEPADRPQSVQEVAAALERIDRELVAAPAATPPAPAPAPAHPSSPVPMIVVAVAAGALLGLLAVFLLMR